MSEAESGRAATVFFSTGDGPEVDEVVDMEDEVFENNGGTGLQNDTNDLQSEKQDKNEATPPMKKARGRPRKCRSLGSLGSTHDPEKLMILAKKLLKGRKFYPCAICEKNVGVNSRECKGCKKWVHGRCHMANKGIGWGGDPKKSDYRCIKCVKKIKGVIGEMVTEEGRKIRRKGSTGATQGKETETEVRKNTKRKGGKMKQRR